MLSAEVRWGNRDSCGAESSGRSLDNRFRSYQPTTGRYLSADPVGQLGGLNLFAYVDGRPTAYSDPLGLQEISFDGLDDPNLAAILASELDPENREEEAEEADCDVCEELAAGLFSGVKPGDSSVDARAKVNAARAAAERAKNLAKGVPRSKLGPSGKVKKHFPLYKNRKAAREAAGQPSGVPAQIHKKCKPRGQRWHFHDADDYDVHRSFGPKKFRGIQ